MNYIGIDIGSTSAKVVAIDENKNIIYKSLRPTGWSSVDVAQNILKDLENNKINIDDSKVVATGYGRVSVPYANKTITEITCHGKGASVLFNSDDCIVVDIGGQDTKIIDVEAGVVKDFMMNDKCSAGTGRFLEVMGNSLAMRPDEVCEFARNGSGVKISSMCTVFAESEVVSLVGKGESKENIAFAIVESIADKVVSQLSHFSYENKNIYLTGGLCECAFLKELLGRKAKKEIETCKDARYAGAMGAAILAMKVK